MLRSPRPDQLRACVGKAGHPAWLIDKDTIMAKRPVKTTKSRSTRDAATEPAPAVETKTSKQNIVLVMLRRASGASIAEIIEATGWQPHSVRGFFSGALKKRLKIDVISEKGEDGVSIPRRTAHKRQVARRCTALSAAVVPRSGGR